MVVRLLLYCLILPYFLLGGEFSAHVNKNPVYMGENFTLTLTLKDTSAKSSPNIDQLRKNFVVLSQQQSSSTMFNNGKMSSSVSWQFVLNPQKEGEYVVPKIAIETSEGTLFTEVITLKALKSDSQNRNADPDLSGITVTADVSQAHPYKAETVIYTVTLTTTKELANLQMQKMQMENASMEQLGDPKVFKKNSNGVAVNVVEFSYLITPFASGPVKIPSAMIQGGIPVKGSRSSGFGYDDQADPFSMMSAFYRLKPFSMASEEIVLDVQPIEASVSPWLPAKSLRMEEIFDPLQTIRVGEFFNRGIKISAEGATSSQLAALNSLQGSTDQIKVYADKPEFKDEIGDRIIRSYRTEQYTLAPTQPGVVILPEIAISWWNTAKKEKVVTTLPARTLTVLPAAATVQSPNNDESATTQLTSTQPSVENPLNLWLYLVIGGLVILLIAIFLWVLALQKKIRSLHEKPLLKIEAAKPLPLSFPEEKKPKKKTSEKPKKEKLPDLNPT